MADDGRSSGGMRAEVLGEARRMIAAEGVPGVTIQAVAKAAGVSKGGLLHHFPSKRSLLEELFGELPEEFSGRLTELMDKDAEVEGRFSPRAGLSRPVGAEETTESCIVANPYTHWCLIRLPE